jgi:transcriptional regulator with GAF, ATPase, and Fis domain/tetratricopeptide (TPR) repeat protein
LKVAKRAEFEPFLADEAERLLWAQSEGLPELLGAGRVQGDVRALSVSEDAAALVLSWISGQSLSKYAETEGTLDESVLLSIALGIGLALSDLHAMGLSHGDVKPDNIIIERTAQGLKVKLLDLGLGGVANSSIPRGGTRRYLAPEVLTLSGEGDGRKRDIYALGLLLAENVRPSFRTLEPAEILEKLVVDSTISELTVALLAPCPGARPSANWVVTRARLGLRIEASKTENVARRRARIRRAYLNVRKSELKELVQRGKIVERVTGVALEWVSFAVERLSAIDSLRSTKPRVISPESIPLRDLDGHERLRFLIDLVGPVAASWPIDVTVPDGTLLDRLLVLAESVDPDALTLSQLEPASADSKDIEGTDPISLALLLWDGLPRQDVLDAAEAYTLSTKAPSAFRLALGRRLRSLGQYGRALSVFGRKSEPLLAAEAAETARRAGDWDGALGRIERLRAVTCPIARARLKATEARILLDRGFGERALALLSDAPESAAVLEVRALIELSLHRRGQALATLERARSQTTGDEERARVESLFGMLHHAEQQPAAAVDDFRRAVEYASRAGAVLEEATYLTGLSAAGVEASRIEEALSAAERATALFEALGRHSDAARAALNRVAGLAILGAEAQAKSAATIALTLARQGKDERCTAYVHLELADALEQDRDGIEHAQYALRLLENASVDEQLMAMARAYEHGIPIDVSEGDGLAQRSDVQPATSLDWWGSRARVALTKNNVTESEFLVGQLTRLLDSPVPTARRGRALSAGASLALLVGHGDAARRLLVVATADAQKLIAGCPAEHRTSVLNRAWIRTLRMPTETLLLPEQISDIEGLVRALGSATELRPLLVQVLDALVLWTGVERGLLLLQAPGGKLSARVGRNLSRNDLVGHQQTLSHSLAEKALALGEPIVAIDATGELSSVHESVHALKLRSVLAVPLIARGEALGVVYLDDRVRRGAFGPKEMAWVRLVGAVAAVAIAEAHDRLRLRRAARRAERAEGKTNELLAKREAELGQARVELARSRDRIPTRYRYEGIIGDSQAMRELLRLVDRVIAADVPVLVLGESGTGKELIARAIHQNGIRAKSAFVAENCGALPEPLLESTLFGHVKGAFTGAARARAGLFEVAHEGTLFLDEVAEMSLGMQTKLLRVLEEGEYWPVGAERSRRVDVRVIAATHRDLESLVGKGAFRQDLYYRLNVVSLRVPPLRERHGDIAALVEYFLKRYSKGPPIPVRSDALELLARYPWPGNVRQLENEIRRALVLSDTSIGPEELSEEIRRVALESRPRPMGLDLRAHVEGLERQLVSTALERTNGNQTRAAELLGVSRFGLQKMLRRLEIRIAELTQESSERTPSRPPVTGGSGRRDA